MTTTANIQSAGKLTYHPTQSQIRNGINNGVLEEEHELFYEDKKGNFVPLIPSNESVASNPNGLIFGIFINDWVRSIYNVKHQVIVIKIKTMQIIPVSLEHAESLGVNQPASKKALVISTGKGF